MLAAKDESDYYREHHFLEEHTCLMRHFATIKIYRFTFTLRTLDCAARSPWTWNSAITEVSQSQLSEIMDSIQLVTLTQFVTTIAQFDTIRTFPINNIDGRKRQKPSKIIQSAEANQVAETLLAVGRYSISHLRASFGCRNTNMPASLSVKHNRVQITYYVPQLEPLKAR